MTEPSIYKSHGKTPQEAFNGIYDLLKFTDDCCLRQENDGWTIRVAIVPPTKKEREEFEVKKR